MLMDESDIDGNMVKNKTRNLNIEANGVDLKDRITYVNKNKNLTSEKFSPYASCSMMIFK